jgi:serine/threonine-protein kinase
VYDIGEVNGHHFLSMEYIKGEELSSLLRRIGRLPTDKSIQIARQICAGLAAAHESGVLHRDLKPSNILIDDGGNARITDFGLAGLAEEFREDEISSGTPAYMAPEQLEGKSVTVRSDIYSLGLVLYELFTGQRAFEAENLRELISLRRSDATPTTPREIVKDLDPVIERVIDRCMQKDPSLRPATALQVAAALPGGDPLAAALAAGETPSPEMVAAAPKKGTLRPAYAAGLLASLVLFLGLSMFLGKRVAVHGLVPLTKSPEVLKEQAAQFAKSFGYTNAPADEALGFRFDADYYPYLQARTNSMNAWSALKSAQPPLIHFWYRQSPLPLMPYDTQVSQGDPPQLVAGMVLLELDTDGRLFYLNAVPDAVVVAPSAQPAILLEPTGRTPDDDETFKALFKAAGLDINQFQPATSEWTPPHAYDKRRAWTGVYPAFPETPIRIEAAAYQGKPVYFEIISPWTKQELARVRSAGQRIFTWILLVVFFIIMALAAVLALRNLRLGRGDRRGAFRVALLLFILRMVHWAFTTHHLPSTEELILLIAGLQSALFWGCFIGLLYLALEPYLRHRWPQRTISWNRLLAGDLRDPLVGRDFLIGSTLGALGILLLYLRLMIPKVLGFYPGMPELSEGFDSSLVGVSSFMRMLMDQLSASMVQAFMLVFLMLFLSLLFRRDWAGAIGGFLLMATLLISGSLGNLHWIGLGLDLLCASLFVVCAMRFGPLAFMSFLVTFHLWVFFPITTDLSAWYATVFIADLVVLLALAVYSYYISLGGQSPFGFKLLAED